MGQMTVKPAEPKAAPAAPSRTPTMHVGPVGDAFEQEADAIAQTVVQRLAAGAGGAPTIRPAGTAIRVAQRRADDSTVGSAGGPLDGAVSERLEQARGGGRPIPGGTRRAMESAFGGVDFGAVRLHSGGESRRLNEAINARAFTVGSDIFFHGAVPNTSSADGQALLAHELTHTLQQSGSAQRTVQRLANPLAGVGTKLASIFGRKDKTRKVDKIKDAASLKAAVDGSATDYVTNLKSQSAGADSVGEQTAGIIGDSFDGIGTGLSTPGDANDAAEALGNKKFGETGSASATNAGIAGSSFGTAASFVSTVMVFVNNESARRKAEAVVGTGAAAIGLASNVTSFAKDAGKTVKGSAKEGMGALTGVVNAVFACYEGVMIAINLYRKWDEKSKTDVAGDSLQMLIKAATAAKESAAAAKAIIDNPVSAAAKSLPAFGIALTLLDLMSEGISLVGNGIDLHKMTNQKRGDKQALAALICKKSKPFNDDGTPNFTDEFEKAVGDPTKVAKAKKSYHHSAYKGDTKGSLKHAARLAAHAFENEDIGREARNYLLSKDIQDINQKRVNRGILNILTTVPSLVGDITTLSGVAAPAGAGLKAASAGAKFGAWLVRTVKQTVHNVREDSKSASAKAERYDDMIKVSLLHVADLIKTGESTDSKDKDAFPGKLQRVQLQMGAMGMPLEKLFSYKEPADAYSKWVDALKHRG